MQGDVAALLRGVVAVEALEVDPEVEQQRLGLGVGVGLGLGVGSGLGSGSGLGPTSRLGHIEAALEVRVHEGLVAGGRRLARVRAAASMIGSGL